MTERSAWSRLMRPALIAVAVLAARGVSAGDFHNVTGYHGDAARSGMYVVPGLTWSVAATAAQISTFDGTVSGAVYAQPLFWHPAAGHGSVIVATENNVVEALDAQTGKPVWQHTLGTPVPHSALPCGDIDPSGVTGTPVIDQKAGVLYLDATVLENGASQHEVFALSLANGSVLAGWPVNVAAGLAAVHESFSPAAQDQRGALALVNGKLYIPFGGNDGDCSTYHGWVVGVDTATHGVFNGWATTAQNRGGIWGQGGVVYDGSAIYATTGNTSGAATWSEGEAIFHLRADLKQARNPVYFYTPSNWLTLDNDDADLGGTATLPISVPVSTGGSASWLLQFGKDGNAYVVDRANMGGIGGQLLTQHVASNEIITGPAAYPVGSALDVAIQADGTGCANPNGVTLTVVQVTASPGPAIGTPWCAAVNGRGAPIATTTDGSSNPIVWMVGAEGDNQLHGFRGDTGAPLVSGGQMSGLRHFVTILAAGDRLYVAGDNKVYAFGFVFGP